MWIENKNSYRRKQIICVILGICVSIMLMSVLRVRWEVLAAQKICQAQEKLSEEVFRFHVLANSDSEKDQNLKLKVRDGILHYIETNLKDEYALDRSDLKITSRQTKEWVSMHLEEICAAGEKIIREEGYDYEVRANVNRYYFPDRRYGEILFPKGYYEALRVEIGNASGHNWWCVLYPSLCFTDAACAVVTDEGEKQIESILTVDEYEAVTAFSKNFKIKSFFYEHFWGDKN